MHTLPHRQPPAKWLSPPPPTRTISELDLSGHSWTADRVDALKLYWADGFSASQIATKIGGVRRNAVIGKVHRLGLAGRAPRVRAVRTSRPNLSLFPARTPQVQYRTFGNTALPVVRKVAPIVPLSAIPDLEPAPEGSLKLMDLNKHMCKWPIGDPMEAGFHFCGRRKAFGVPYCGHHAAIAHPPLARKNKEEAA